MKPFVFDVDPDIRAARTPPGRLYHDRDVQRLLEQRVLAPSWQLDPRPVLDQPGGLRPWVLLEGSLHEPLLWTRTKQELNLLPNVCTHRGNVMVDRPCEQRAVRCPYHGRRFDLSGRCLGSPGFEAVGTEDDLAPVAHDEWRGFGFGSLEPPGELQGAMAPLSERVGFLPIESGRIDPETSRRYRFDGHWLLYCDNYLEGLHIPFVHAALAKTLDVGDYPIHLFDSVSLQVGIAAEGEPAFSLPPGHPDHGRRVAGYYFFLFPNTMLNFYPWGISINLVLPQGPAETVVQYVCWVWDEDQRGRGAGGDLDRVELEDEAVVGRVQRGTRSRSYRRGRYAPDQERAVHHFHRQLAARLA